MSLRVTLLLAVAGLLAVVGCGKESDETNPAPARPVLTVVAEPRGKARQGFAGTIQPRYQTERGFQVLGRIIKRDVDVGDTVKVGQRLAEIDPLPFVLSVRSDEADLAKAKSQLANTSSAFERVRTLLARQASSQADFDTAEQAAKAAAASVQQAEANLAKAREQLGYTVLTADIEGVVTQTQAQVGQIASAGTTVMTLARTDVREAVVDLPEDVVRSLAAGDPFEIRLQADLSITQSGKVREIAPEADASTRTRRVKITLDQAVDPFRLGATITAVATTAQEAAAIEIPRSAILEQDGAMRVWLVNPAAKTVATVPVEIAAQDAHSVRIASGLKAGARVVVAGVHSLAEGQKVKLDEGSAE